jgi:hypothetical protein
MSKPELFIVESLKFEDEREKLYEGRIISEILALSGKTCEHYYIRTKRELKEILKTFSASKYRYLHLSCHGNANSMATTLDSIPFSELGPLMGPYLDRQRLFVSACSMTNAALAEAIMPDSGCYSILGPDQKIGFSDAAVLWASFYHVMFTTDSEAMKYDIIKAKAQEVSEMYRVKLTLIRHSKSSSKKYRLRTILPRKKSG